MKKQDLYTFIRDMRREEVEKIYSEIELIKDKAIIEILEKVKFKEFHNNWKEQDKKRVKFVESLRENGLKVNYQQEAGSYYMANSAYGGGVMDEDRIITSLRGDMEITDEIVAKNKLIEQIVDEFNKLEQQIKLLSTAKKGYDLLIELGFNKEELDAYVQEKPNAVVVQDFNNDLLGLNKG